METSLAGKTFFVCYKQAGLVTVLAEADISLFALSTYDIDYVLVKCISEVEAVESGFKSTSSAKKEGMFTDQTGRKKRGGIVQLSMS